MFEAETKCFLLSLIFRSPLRVPFMAEQIAISAPLLLSQGKNYLEKKINVLICSGV